MSKIVSIETLKKQENDFITRVVLANLVFVFRIQSRDQPALTCTPRLRFSCMRRWKSPLLLFSIFYTSTSNCPIRKLCLCHVSMNLIAMSRITSSISEPAFFLKSLGNMGLNTIRVDHARQTHDNKMVNKVIVRSISGEKYGRHFVKKILLRAVRVVERDLIHY
jgi:hypothetical protein